MKRASIGAEHQRAAIEDLHQAAQSAAECTYHRNLCLLQDDALRRQFAIGATADQHWLQSEVAVQRIAHRRPALRKPVFLRLARRNDNRCDRSIEDAQSFALLPELMWPGPKVPDRRCVRDADGVEKLEVLILHMLHRVRPHLCIRENPVQIARARHVEPELHRRTHHARDHAGLQVHLQCEYQIESTFAKLSSQIVVCAPAIAALEQQDFIDVRMSAHQRCWPGLQDPGHSCIGPVTLQCREHRQYVHCITHRAHHHDAHTIERGAHRRRRSAGGQLTLRGAR